jgi:N-methylhydantoinase B
VYEEGFCLPPVKLVEGGVPNQLVRKILARNVRVPGQVLGDVDALIAANSLGERRLQGMLDADPDLDLREAAEHICGATERAVRKSIAAIPDGRYTASIDLDGFEEPKTIHVTVDVEGDEMTVDYAGTSAQSRFGINSASPTYGYTRYGLACLLAPDVPNNEGALRPVTIKVPEGSLLKPTKTAAVSANFPAHAIPSVLSRALLGPLPARVSAAAGTPFWVVGIRGEGTEGPFASLLCFNGGAGCLRGSGRLRDPVHPVQRVEHAGRGRRVAGSRAGGGQADRPWLRRSGPVARRRGSGGCAPFGARRPAGHHLPHRAH